MTTSIVMQSSYVAPDGSSLWRFLGDAFLQWLLGRLFEAQLLKALAVVVDQIIESRARQLREWLGLANLAPKSMLVQSIESFATDVVQTDVVLDANTVIAAAGIQLAAQGIAIGLNAFQLLYRLTKMRDQLLHLSAGFLKRSRSLFAGLGFSSGYSLQLFRAGRTGGTLGVRFIQLFLQVRDLIFELRVIGLQRRALSGELLHLLHRARIIAAAAHRLGVGESNRSDASGREKKACQRALWIGAAVRPMERFGADRSRTNHLPSDGFKNLH